jgi:hypothetical protein
MLRPISVHCDSFQSEIRVISSTTGTKRRPPDVHYDDSCDISSISDSPPRVIQYAARGLLHGGHKIRLVAYGEMTTALS